MVSSFGSVERVTVKAASTRLHLNNPLPHLLVWGCRVRLRWKDSMIGREAGKVLNGSCLFPGLFPSIVTGPGF